MLLHFVCPGNPVSGKNNKRSFVSKNRSTGKVSAHITLSAAVKRWYAAQVPVLEAQFRALHLPTLRELVAVELSIYHADDLLDQRAPDGDNVENAVFDALVKAKILADDKFVVRCAWERYVQPARPRIEIDVRTLRARD